MWAIQDKWVLISWGMRQKNAILFRKQFLSATEELKDRFKILLSKFLRKRAEKQFDDIKNLILNFDKEDQKKPKQKSMVVNELNLDVIVEQDDLDESTNLNSYDKIVPNLEKPMQTINEQREPLTQQQAVNHIQNFLLGRHLRQKSREMWEDLHTKYSGLPVEVKRNFVKMWIAKQEQAELKKRVNRYYHN